MFTDAKPGDVFLTRNRQHAVEITGLAQGFQGRFIEYGSLTVPTHVPMYVDALGLHQPEHIYSWWPEGTFRRGHQNDVDLLEKLESPRR